MRARGIILAGLTGVGLVLAVLILSRWQSDDQPPAMTAQPVERPGPSTPAHEPAAWQAPQTANPREFAEAFVTAVWTYDSRVHTYDQWRVAVAEFVAASGTPASRQVALGMLPTWRQWEDLTRRSAHARIASLRTTVPTELASLEKDPRAPAGWHGFVISAEQTVATAARQSTVARQASVSVVCTHRCYLWSVTPEVPR